MSTRIKINILILITLIILIKINNFINKVNNQPCFINSFYFRQILLSFNISIVYIHLLTFQFHSNFNIICLDTSALCEFGNVEIQAQDKGEIM